MTCAGRIRLHSSVCEKDSRESTKAGGGGIATTIEISMSMNNMIQCCGDNEQNLSRKIVYLFYIQFSELFVAVVDVIALVVIYLNMSGGSLKGCIQLHSDIRKLH